MSICNTYHVWHKLAKVGCKSCIANSRLTKCNDSDIFCFVTDLEQTKYPFLDSYTYHVSKVQKVRVCMSR